MKHLIGKKARILSLRGANHDQFNVGDVVEIVTNDTTGFDSKRAKFIEVGNKKRVGYVDVSNLEILADGGIVGLPQSNGIIKVDAQGIIVEGYVSDVLTLLKGLQ
jgi:hypothetical protein